MGSSNDILVTSKAVLDDEIENADVKTTAGIVESKLAFSILTGHDHDGVNSKLVLPGFSGDLSVIANLAYFGMTQRMTGSVVPGEEPALGKTVYEKADGTIALANATDGTKMRVKGVVVESLGANSWVVMMDGIWRNDALAFVARDLLYAQAVAGELTTAEPAVIGNIVQLIAVMIATGYMYIRPDFGMFEVV